MPQFALDCSAFLVSFSVTPKKIVRYLEKHGQSSRPPLKFAAPENVRTAAVQMAPRPYRGLEDYLSEMLYFTKSAADTGAHLIVFPQYTGLLPLSLMPGCGKLLLDVLQTPLEDLPASTLERFSNLVRTAQGFLYEIHLYTFSTLALLQKAYICAGSIFVWEDQQLYHRSLLFSPDGEAIHTQDQLCPTGLAAALGVTPGQSAQPADTLLGKVGIVIGADAYYFELFHILQKKSAQIIAMPLCADTFPAGLDFCRARQSPAYLIESPLLTTKYHRLRAQILSPMGVSAACEQPEGAVCASRIDLCKLSLPAAGWGTDPTFLFSDYLPAYRIYAQQTQKEQAG